MNDFYEYFLFYFVNKKLKIEANNSFVADMRHRIINRGERRAY